MIFNSSSTSYTQTNQQEQNLNQVSAPVINITGSETGDDTRRFYGIGSQGGGGGGAGTGGGGGAINVNVTDQGAFERTTALLSEGFKSLLAGQQEGLNDAFDVAASSRKSGDQLAQTALSLSREAATRFEGDVTRYVLIGAGVLAAILVWRLAR